MRFVKIPAIFLTVADIGCVVIRKCMVRDSQITFCKNTLFRQCINFRVIFFNFMKLPKYVV